MSRSSSLLIPIPVFFPLITAFLCALVGLPHVPPDAATWLMAFSGPAGAAIGVFTGLVLAGAPMATATRVLVLTAVCGPAVVAPLTVVLVSPLLVLLHVKGASPQGLALVTMVWWYLVSAGVGVEVLDRGLRRVAGS